MVIQQHKGKYFYFEASEGTHEDAELLRSLVEPLADQIKALKEKLRSTDEQLQKCKECGHHVDEITKRIDQSSQHVNTNTTISTNTSFDSPKVTICDMCSNYEAQLVKEQKRAIELEAKVQAAEKAAERHKEELLKEIGFRKEMEEKWNEKKEEHKQQVAELTRATESKIGKEAAEEKVNTFQSDIMLLKHQITNDQHQWRSMEESLEQEIRTLRKQADQSEKEKKRFIANQEKLLTSEKSNDEIIHSQKDKLDELNVAIVSAKKRKLNMCGYAL
ncbi:hypothetical protein NQ317_017446 [Molorchus minor]|uniref:Rabaptin GTPase-Rab5 binding domain-containing protein n=1 Tax=Molorchus minor TaxID=1323400 RepID=A0ABQ9JFA1_9CUCU|nr:hypothetical protein NQ317_017446 [Molorchus minor]